MKLKITVTAVVLVWLAAWLATSTEKSDWRYPGLLITQAPKMPFRYFV